MKDKDILIKAIEKAFPSVNGVCQCEGLLDSINDLLEFDYAGGQNYYCLIFSHCFAKAFFGENHILHPTEVLDSEILWHHDEQCYLKSDRHKKVISWQYYLQKMVLEKEPLKYLEKFLN